METQTYKVTKDGRTVAEFQLAAEAWAYVLQMQSQSVHWAVTYEGWDIISPLTGSLGANQ